MFNWSPYKDLSFRMWVTSKLEAEYFNHLVLGTGNYKRSTNRKVFNHFVFPSTGQTKSRWWISQQLAIMFKRVQMSTYKVFVWVFKFNRKYWIGRIQCLYSMYVCVWYPVSVKLIIHLYGENNNIPQHRIDILEAIFAVFF